jgi:hypothetical protein
MHSENCVRNLPGVFDQNKKPWIDIKGASSEEIMKAIDRCPSGALSYKKKGSEKETPAEAKEKAAVKTGTEPVTQIKVVRDGPLMVRGNCILIDEGGKETLQEKPFALCRCGRSKNKPYCDGSHRFADEG